MNFQPAEIIEYAARGGTDDFEIIRGTGIMFSDDVWNLSKSNKHMAESRVTLKFENIKCEPLKRKAKYYYLQALVFNTASPHSLRVKSGAMNFIMNFLYKNYIENLNEINDFIMGEFVRNLELYAMERNLSCKTVERYLLEINFLTTDCIWCPDSIPKKYYLPYKRIEKEAKRIAPKKEEATPIIPDSIGRKIAKSVLHTLEHILPKGVEDSKKIEPLKKSRPKEWRAYIGRSGVAKSAASPFSNMGTMGKFCEALLDIRTALQIYILYFTGMRPNELLNLPVDCCSMSDDDRACMLSGGVKKGAYPQEKNVYVWFAPKELKGFVDQFVEIMKVMEINPEYLFVALTHKSKGQRVSSDTTLRRCVYSYCNENNLLETKDGEQWELKLRQFRTHYVHFMTQNHLNFSMISEQMKHAILDMTFRYSGPLEGSLATVVDPFLMSDLQKGKMEFNWKEAKKALCCETASYAPEDSQLMSFRSQFKAAVTPKERDKVIEEFLAVGIEPYRMPVGVCVAHPSVRHKCGMQNNPLGCKPTCENFTCEVHEYGRIVYEKSVVFRKLANNPSQPKRALYGKMADKFDSLIEGWETAECLGEAK
jgi:Phage integrase family.